MHVHRSNILINILRIIKTQILNRYRQEWEQSGSRVVDAPRGRTCSRTPLLQGTKNEKRLRNGHPVAQDAARYIP